MALAEANVGIARQLDEMMLLRGLLAFYTNLDTSDHRTKSKDDGEYNALHKVDIELL